MKQIIYLSVLRGKSKEALDGKYYEWITNTAQYKYMQSSGLVNKSVQLKKDYSPDTIQQVELNNGSTELVVDVSVGKGKTYLNLENLISTANKYSGADIPFYITIPDLSSLGYNANIIKANYRNILSAGIPLHIPTTVDNFTANIYSTAKADGNLLASFSLDTFLEKIEHLKDTDIKKWRGYATDTGFSQAFLDAYYLHQNFLIGDKEALLLSGLSRKTFSVKWKQLENQPYKPNLLYALSQEELSTSGDLYMLYDLDLIWHERYEKITGYKVDGYYKLPRRCGKLPSYIRTYEYAFLLDNPLSLKTSTKELKPLSNEELNSILLKPISAKEMLDLRDNHDIPLLAPETFKCYVCRELEANDKCYQKHLTEGYDSKLCSAIQQALGNPDTTDEDRNSFLMNYIETI